MPTLKTLSTEMADALGKELPKIYKEFLDKQSSLKDDSKAKEYVDSVIKRFKLLSTAAVGAGYAETKEKYLKNLKNHGSLMAVLAFSKPDDVVNRLKELHLSTQDIAKITATMEQAGATEDDVCSVVTSVVTCETSSALLCGSNSRHHHHHRGHYHCHY